MPKLVLQSLYEQQQITETEIHNRKLLFGIDEQVVATLKKFSPIVQQKISLITDSFYQQQIKNDDISLLIGDVETLTRLKSAQTRYISSLFAGQYNLSYVNSRLRIGLVHKRIGVTPKLYLSAVELLKHILTAHVSEQLSTTLDHNKFHNALDAILQFDVSYVFDTYIKYLIEEIVISKKETEKYAESLEDKIQHRTERLKTLSLKDDLTGLYNRRAFDEFIDKELLTAKRYKKTICLLFIDLDNFKMINDKHGHAFGDRYLQEFGIKLRSLCRNSDLLFRYGGDEFCILMPNTPTKQAQKLVDKLYKNLSDSHPLTIGLSAARPSSFKLASELIEDADKAMYQTKNLNKK